MDPAALAAREDAEGLPALAAAMWWDACGNWDRAHQLAQSVDTAAGAWVHGYLHRKEGDLSNADYWYRRAGRRRPAVSLDEEWAEIVRTI